MTQNQSFQTNSGYPVKLKRSRVISRFVKKCDVSLFILPPLYVNGEPCSKDWLIQEAIMPAVQRSYLEKPPGKQC